MTQPVSPVQGVRLYGTARSQQIKGGLFLAAVTLVVFFREHLWRLDLPNIAVLALLVVFALRCASAFTEQLRISENCVEVRTIFCHKKLGFDQIRGRREYWSYGRYGAYRRFKIEPNDDRLPTITFGKYDSLDDDFYRWFNSLPDLKAAPR